MKMLRIAFLLPLLALISVGSNPARSAEEKAEKDKIVGKWEVAESDNPALKGSTLEFTKDGKLLVKVKLPDNNEFPFEAAYEVSGADLKVITKGPDGNAKTDVKKVEKLTDAELVLKDDKDKITKFKRVKSSPPANFTRTEDVIYGRKYGLALTMDVFTPKEKANGRGIIWCVSGGWFSSKEAVNAVYAEPFLDRGYTVFEVVHGSQPKFTIPEVIEDMHRAVRFIKANAVKYNIDPDKLGIAGGSAGGHLSLMQGCAPKEGNPKAADPVERQSSKVAAVACFFPPTDFLNYGKEGAIALGGGTLKDFNAPFDFHEFDPKTKSFVPVTDETKRREIGKQISPVYFVTKDSAPTLIFHGDADALVPIQQAELIIKKLKENNVPCKLVVKKGAGHGWLGLDKDIPTLADWFDKYLLEKAKPAADRGMVKATGGAFRAQ